MNEELKFWIAVWIIVGIAVCVMTLTIGIVTLRTNTVAFENGYEAAVLPGSANAVWVKAK